MLSDKIPKSFPIISILSPFKNFIEVLVNIIIHTSEIKCIAIEKERHYLYLQVIHLSE